MKIVLREKIIDEQIYDCFYIGLAYWLIKLSSNTEWYVSKIWRFFYTVFHFYVLLGTSP